MSTRVLYLGPPESLAVVRENLPPAWHVELATQDDAVDALLPDTDVVLDAYMRVRFPSERLAAAPKLKLFVTATTGADHVDADHLAARNIPLLTLRGQKEALRNITPAAEHSWLLLMACARQLVPAAHSVLQGEWDRNRFPGLMLRGRTLGVIGCGRIGEWMSRYARAFGMRCVGYDPYLEEFPDTIEKASLEDVLRAADIVSIHVPLTEDTRALLKSSEFALMKQGVILINTSRGDIIDESALLEALTSGHVASAGLDVLMGEPDIAQHSLVQYAQSHDNLIITPHIGGYSPDALAYVLAFSCGRIREELGVTNI